MSDNNSITNTKPCLVQTAQGFSVSYEGKFLYSKYNPQKAINQIIENLTIQPQTIILCASPVLNYGLKELSQKLPDDCLMLGCELEPQLVDFIQENKNTSEGDFSNIPHFSFITKDELYNLGPELIKQKAGTFRRIIRIDFSAAAQLHSDIYDKVVENVTNALMTYWANRVTLVKFGRKYCTNFFKNLSVCDKTIPIQKYFGAFEKPVLVFGAGESAQDGIERIKKSDQNDYCILCADTSLQPLLANDITPDGVFIEEAQNVISKCFIGTQSSDIHIFAGLSSIHSITRYFKPEQISFFTTEFTQARFIDRFEKAGILPPKNNPFGSVGITAYYYALLFRKDSSVPVETYGLDFAYSAGRTHTKGAMADNARFQHSNRIKTDTNFGAAFNQTAFKKTDKMYTTPIMARYDSIMSALRQVQVVVPEPVEGPQKITSFLRKERKSLEELKSLLTGETKLPAEQLEEKITQLVQDREYLYLHFPDGHKFAYTQSFLNRVRIEIDYYLKALRHAQGPQTSAQGPRD
ncbi:MAG: motility associated factor glycosyltransferase family protein [Treponema sp.]|nr:motility associated factor glycosyltransferase family protein [Treponema sp.]